MGHFTLKSAQWLIYFIKIDLLRLAASAALEIEIILRWRVGIRCLGITKGEARYFLIGAIVHSLNPIAL